MSCKISLNFLLIQISIPFRKLQKSRVKIKQNSSSQIKDLPRKISKIFWKISSTKLQKINFHFSPIKSFSISKFQISIQFKNPQKSNSSKIQAHKSKIYPRKISKIFWKISSTKIFKLQKSILLILPCLTKSFSISKFQISIQFRKPQKSREQKSSL